MKSSKHYDEKMVGQGRALAQGMHLEKMRIEKNKDKAVKRRATMLSNAADKLFNIT